MLPLPLHRPSPSLQTLAAGAIASLPLDDMSPPAKIALAAALVSQSGYLWQIKHGIARDTMYYDGKTETWQSIFAVFSQYDIVATHDICPVILSSLERLDWTLTNALLKCFQLTRATHWFCPNTSSLEMQTAYKKKWPAYPFPSRRHLLIPPNLNIIIHCRTFPVVQRRPTHYLANTFPQSYNYDNSVIHHQSRHILRFGMITPNTTTCLSPRRIFVRCIGQPERAKR